MWCVVTLPKVKQNDGPLSIMLITPEPRVAPMQGQSFCGSGGPSVLWNEGVGLYTGLKANDSWFPPRAGSDSPPKLYPATSDCFICAGVVDKGWVVP